MNKLFGILLLSILLLIPSTEMSIFTIPNLNSLQDKHISLEKQFYQILQTYSNELERSSPYRLERTILLRPDPNFETIYVAEYWKIAILTDRIISAPQNTPGILILLPNNTQNLILPDNSLGIFQKFSNHQAHFSPAFTLDSKQIIEFPLLYEISYPDIGSIVFDNTLYSSLISISLPADDILIEADGFLYDGKRSIEETTFDIYRKQEFQANSQFTIHLVRSNFSITPVGQMTGFLISLVFLGIGLFFWFKSKLKKSELK